MPSISSRTPLAGNANQVIDVKQTDWADNIVGAVFADVAGTLFIEQSFDGTIWTDVSTTVAVTANTPATFNVALIAPQVRLRYLNGASPQTVFRLNARFASAGAR